MTKTSHTVLHFSPRSGRSKAGASDAGAAAVIWPVADLPDERECGEWLDRVIVGRSYESTALSLWRNQPNLRLATEKLASYITPMWPAPRGGSLLEEAVERAVHRAQEAIDQGQAFEGRLVGVYLYGLLCVVNDIAQLVIRGEDAHGQIRRWEYFSEPLLQWARRHGIRDVLVQKIPNPPSEVVLSGLRTHMTACLTDPVDAGYLAKHAAQG